MQDPKNGLTYATLIAPKSQTNNAAGSAVDVSQFVGQMAMVVQIGVKSTGDNDGAIAVRVVHSHDNNASNGTNYGTATVATTNNTSAIGQILIDKRDCRKYVFAVPALTGTNSPAYPLAAVLVGVKQVQP